MKKIVRYVLAIVCRQWSKIYTFRISERMKYLRNELYTMWIRNFLGELGKESTIGYPCSLQGGGQRRVQIGNKTSIHGHSVLGCWEKYGEQRFSPIIRIGDNCNIGEYVHITACNKITIGNGLLTGRFVYIGDNAHGGFSLEEANTPPDKRSLRSKGEIEIGNNVWIGDKTTILGGVTIGDNVIIGANSVVNRNVPSNCMVGGAPARVIKEL